jgi:diketogulonate reductase-like aldo/keto reductase
MGKLALAAGIRHIDTAQGYNNETETGAVVAEKIAPREQVWITSKCVCLAVVSVLDKLRLNCWVGSVAEGRRGGR